MSNWYRITKGFFEIGSYCSNGEVTHLVEFTNTCPWDFVTAIEVVYMKSMSECQFLGLRVAIKFMPVPLDDFMSALNTCLSKNSLRQTIQLTVDDPLETCGLFSRHHCVEDFLPEIFDGTLFLHFKSAKAFLEFGQILREINSEYKNIFSDDLLVDFDSIGDYLRADTDKLDGLKIDPAYSGQTLLESWSEDYPNYISVINKNTFSHKIPFADVNWDWEASGAFLALADDENILTDEKYERLKYWLAQGDDPNKAEIGYEDPMYLAVSKHPDDMRTMELLIYYYGNPFRRRLSTNHPYSVFDHALKAWNVNLLNLILSCFSIEPPIALKVKRIDSCFRDNAIQTRIDLYDETDSSETVIDSLSIELRKLVPDDEEAKIISMSKTAFKMEDDPDQKKIAASILQDLHARNHWVEIIRGRDNKLIGYSIYELIQMEDEEKLVWYCSLSLLLTHRKTGLMGALIWRYAHALQTLYPQKSVGVFFLSVSYNSYRLAQDYLFWPMYQPACLAVLMKKLLNKLNLPDDVAYTHANLVCYIDKQILVANDNPRSTMRSRFFYNNVLDETLGISNAKAAPVLFFVTDQSFQLLDRHCQNLGIHLGTHLKSLSMALHEFLSACHVRPPGNFFSRTNSIKNAQLLFWEDLSVPSTEIYDVTYKGFNPKL